MDSVLTPFFAMQSVSVFLTKTSRDLALSLLFTLLVWAFFSWPLPRYFSRAIPASAENVEKHQIRRMIHGDHLQLLFNYWLAADMTAGRTPWATNPYQFNLGADTPLQHNAWGNLSDQPFTTLFALCYRLGGRAFAWNLIGVLALWSTFFFTWMLLRHFCSNDLLAFLSATPALLFPFRWTNLLGGSPMGFAIMWVPLLFWSLHAALIGRRWGGAVIATLSIIFMRWSDTHVFFFSTMALPAWVLFLVLSDRQNTRSVLHSWPGTLARLALPTLASGILVLLGQIQKSTLLVNTTIGGGRSLSEIALYSPHLSSLWSRPAQGIEAQIFVGYGLLVFLGLIGVVAVILLFRDREQREKHLATLGVLAAIAVLILLALGINGPLEGAPFRLARKCIPPYSMIRQPAKIFCLFPMLCAIATALFFSASLRFRPLILVGILFLTAWAVESKLKIQPSLCLIDTEQTAYQAVARSAAQAGKPPHALILPLWPGDSSWSSLYEHYASLYRIRMINGYTPIVPHNYIHEVFDRFNSANGGHLSDEQLDELLRRGIDYLIFHEDAFPEIVSYFPVAFTLRQLLNHPRLEFLAQDRAAWSFRILPESASRTHPVFPEWTIFFPTYTREMEGPTSDPRKMADDASGKAYVSLDALHPRYSLPSFEYLQVPDGNFLIRLRGPGTFQWTIGGPDGVTRQYVLGTTNSFWEWQRLCFTNLPPTPAFTSTLTRLQGRIDLDMMLYTAGHWDPLAPGQTLRLPAPLFFHAGYTEPKTGYVVLDPDRVPHGVVFYGLRLPLDGDRFRFELSFESSAPAGQVLGSWTLVRDGQSICPAVPLVAGQSAAATVAILNNRPVEFRLDFARSQTLVIKELIITRLE